MTAPRRRLYARGSDEFSRVVTLSDGIFAIAMTLLVVTVTVPVIANGASVGALADALDEQSGTFVSFFISFAVIARYWVANHRFTALLKAMDSAYINWTLVLLAFVAFLPFPTDLLGEYFENPLAIVIYAVTVSVVSGLEVVLLRQAHRGALLRKPLPEDVYRWARLAALAPVAAFPLSIPIAFIDTTLAALVWVLALPLGVWSDRRKPAEADDYLGQ